MSEERIRECPECGTTDKIVVLHDVHPDDETIAAATRFRCENCNTLWTEVISIDGGIEIRDISRPGGPAPYGFPP